MWISKKRYNELVSESDNYANLIREEQQRRFEELIFAINKCKDPNKVIYHSNCVLLSYNLWDSLKEKQNELEDKIKELQALSDWYKNKYAETKVLLEEKDKEK